MISKVLSSSKSLSQHLRLICNSKIHDIYHQIDWQKVCQYIMISRYFKKFSQAQCLFAFQASFLFVISTTSKPSQGLWLLSSQVPDSILKLLGLHFQNPQLLDIKAFILSQLMGKTPENWHLGVKQGELSKNSLTTSPPTTRYRAVSREPEDTKLSVCGVGWGWADKEKEKRKKLLCILKFLPFLVALCLKGEPCLHSHIPNILILDQLSKSPKTF